MYVGCMQIQHCFTEGTWASQILVSTEILEWIPCKYRRRTVPCKLYNHAHTKPGTWSSGNVKFLPTLGFMTQFNCFIEGALWPLLLVTAFKIQHSDKEVLCCVVVWDQFALSYGTGNLLQKVYFSAPTQGHGDLSKCYLDQVSLCKILQLHFL